MKKLALLFVFLFCGCQQSQPQCPSADDLLSLSKQHRKLSKQYKELAEQLSAAPAPEPDLAQPDLSKPEPDQAVAQKPDLSRSEPDLSKPEPDEGVKPDLGQYSDWGMVYELPSRWPSSVWQRDHGAEKYNRQSPSGWSMDKGYYEGWIVQRTSSDEERRPYPMAKLPSLKCPCLVVFDTRITSLQMSGSQWGQFFSSFHREWDNFSVTLIPGPKLDMSGGITDLRQHSSRDLPMNQWFTLQVWVDYDRGEYRGFVDGRLVLSAPKPHSSQDRMLWAHWGVYGANSVSDMRMEQRNYRIYMQPDASAVQRWGR